MNETTEPEVSRDGQTGPAGHTGPAGQSGGGMLTIVAVLGLLLTLVQGTVYYRAKAGAKFLGSEKNKVLAMQMAEAGVENNIADFGRRTTKIHPGQNDTVTYDHKALEGGYFTSQLTTVAVGDSADTVDLTSAGMVGAKTQTIHTRLRLRKRIAVTTALVPQTTTAVTQKVRSDFPALTASPEWAACAGPCNVCHVPLAPGPLSGRTVIFNVAKPTLIGVHGGHPGDYITDPVTGCHKYDSLTTTTVTMVSQTTTDTTIKTQVLSWK